MKYYCEEVTHLNLYEVVDRAIENYIEVEGIPNSGRIRVELETRYEWEKDFEHIETDVEIIIDEKGEFEYVYEWDIFEGQTILRNITIWAISYT